MKREEQLDALQAALNSFTATAERIPDALFLHRYGEWSPRDVVAHLIGWNYYTRVGCEQLRQGQLPTYYEHTDPEFRFLNAQSLVKYAATNKHTLLDELQDSLNALYVYLASIPAQDWEADCGVRYEGTPETIASVVAALIQDYLGHGQEIARWTGIRADGTGDATH